MADGAVVDIPALVDARPVGRFQYGVAALCALTVFLDGFDTQSIAFVAPSIVKEWHVARPALAHRVPLSRSRAPAGRAAHGGAHGEAPEHGDRPGRAEVGVFAFNR